MSIVAEPVNEDYSNYKKPSIELLNKVNKKSDENGKKKVLKNASLLEKTLSDFGVKQKLIKLQLDLL